MNRKSISDVAEQVRTRRDTKAQPEPELHGNSNLVISTGSTLLDLAVSWERVRGGGLPAGILVEIFGPPSSGKTTFLCEIAGGAQR